MQVLRGAKLPAAELHRALGVERDVGQALEQYLEGDANLLASEAVP
jgi:hypothetical protein